MIASLFRAVLQGGRPGSVMGLAACLFLALGCGATSQPVREAPSAAPGALRSVSGSVDIPKGAGSAVAKSKPVVYLDFKGLDACKEPEFKLDASALQVARSEVEALLPRMKRFTVYSIYNDAAGRKVRELQDAGMMEDSDPSQLPPPDLLLNISATLNAQKQENMRATVIVDYTLTVLYTLTDSKGKVLDDTPDASGSIRSPNPNDPDAVKIGQREFTLTFNRNTGKEEYRGGFDPKNPDSGASVVRNLMADINKGLAAKLAIALPITTEVTGLNGSKTKFSIRAGQKDGVFKGTKVVVWMSDGDFSYAIASATAEPVADKANLNIQQWNDADPDASEIVKKLKESGMDEFKGKLFATTTDIPLAEMLSPLPPPKT